MVSARSTLLGALVLFASTAVASAEPAVIARQMTSDNAATVSSSETTTASATPATGTDAAAIPTEVTGCHTHSDGYYCFEGDAEWEVTSEIADTETAPDEYSNCQAGSNNNTIQCADGFGGQVTLIREGSEEEEEDHDHDHGSSTTSGTASPTVMESGTGAAAETPSSTTTANVGNVVFPASGMSLAALLAYLL